MKEENIQLLSELSQRWIDQKIRYRFIDKRWKKRGDVDIIVKGQDIKKFEKDIKQNNFKRKGKWPPQTRSYKAFINNEIVSLNAHVGGYIGGFGGGLGSIGKILEPKSVPETNNEIDNYLTAAEQIFILLYKYSSRKNKQKYEEEFSRLVNLEFDSNHLKELTKKAFKNYQEIVNKSSEKVEIKDITLVLNNWEKTKLSFRGKPNKILRRTYKFFFPAPYIAFVGCNGTGKSTTIENTKKKLIEENLEVDTYYSGRMEFKMLPINKILKLFKPNKIEGKKNPEGSKEKYAREVRIFDSPTLNFVAPFIFYVEYFLRYLIKVRPKRVFNDVVLTDRSFLDLFSSPNMNKKVCKFLFKMMPQPKHILLWNDPEILAQRRPEFRVEDLRKQIEAFNQFSDIYLMKVKTENFEVVNEIAKKVEKLI